MRMNEWSRPSLTTRMTITTTIKKKYTIYDSKFETVVSDWLIVFCVLYSRWVRRNPQNDAVMTQCS